MARRPWGAVALVLVCSAVGLSCPALDGVAYGAWQLPSWLPTQSAAIRVPSLPPLESVSAPPQTWVGSSTSVSALLPPPEPPPDPDETDPEPDAKPAPPLAAPAISDVPTLGAVVKEAWVYAKPNWKARRIGYLRAGALVERSPTSVGAAGCEKGWYRLVPRGYVCANQAVTLEPAHAVLEAAARRPDRTAGLPYDYVMSNYPPPPLYAKLPSEEEQELVESQRRGQKDKNPAVRLQTAELEWGPLPSFLLYDRTIPTIQGPPLSPQALVAARPVPRSGFALLQSFEWTGRPFGLTTELNLIPLDRTRAVKASVFKGIVLDDDNGLPAAFVRSRAARRYRLNPLTHSLSDAGPIAYRQGMSLTGRQERFDGSVYLEARDGTWIRQKDNVVIIPPMKNVPGWAVQGRKWIEVSILHQTLVAWDGTRPAYATLVSTGADGLGDPKKTHSTVQGVFAIHTKHVSITMDGNDVGDEFDLRDVPYVQYFTEGYALHAAYWHDEFGTPRSHGCVNLSPQDAAWLFAWSNPQVPEGWHGYLQTRGGTIVYVHP